MALGLASPTLPLRIDDDGVVRLGETRVTLDIVVEAFNDGFAAEEIAQQYTSLALADVYATIAYYLQHRTEVDAYLTERRVAGAALRRRCEARWDPRGVRERLLRRRPPTNG